MGIFDLDFGSIITGVGDVIDDLHTSDEEEHKLALESKQIDADIAMSQMEVNKAEAQHKSLFVAGGRPFIIWVCGVALALAYIPKALVLTIIWTIQAYGIISGSGGALPAFPDLGITDLVGLLGAMLGVSGMRSFDKEKGTAIHALNPPPKPPKKKSFFKRIFKR